MSGITTLILTKNEEKNIEKCIKSAKLVSERIIVVDSYSTDKTVDISIENGAEIIQNKFVNHGTQWNYAVEKAEITTTWIMRLDADEELTIESAKDLTNLCKENYNTNVNGIIFRFKIMFMGKYLMHGGTYPIRRMSCYRAGHGKMDTRNMQDQIIIEDGKYIELKSDLNHYDYKDLSYWISKHNWYASGAATDYLENINVKEPFEKYDWNSRINRYLKANLYYKFPVRIRSKLNFIYRYYFRLGFLDGIEGYYYAFFQAYWYRVLVDAKIHEITEQNINIKQMGDLK
jgi:glycosyltransferase involved in cell wall biosynthesis